MFYIETKRQSDQGEVRAKKEEVQGREEGEDKGEDEESGHLFGVNDDDGEQQQSRCGSDHGTSGGSSLVPNRRQSLPASSYQTKTSWLARKSVRRDDQN